MNERKVKLLMIQSIRLLTDHPDLKIIKSHIGVQEYEAIQYLTLLTDMGTDRLATTIFFPNFLRRPAVGSAPVSRCFPL